VYNLPTLQNAVSEPKIYGFSAKTWTSDMPGVQSEQRKPETAPNQPKRDAMRRALV